MNAKSSSRWSEVFKFLVSGGICFLIQFGLLVLLRDGAGLDTLIALPIAFLVATVANYIFSVLWIWPSAKDSNTAAKAGFLITSLLGLAWNELLMWIFRLIFGEEQVLFTILGKDVSMYMVNACITTVLVMFWNFFTKRAVLQSKLLSRFFR
ncbi:MAG: GtrA family protein [Clostridia bacterium]|nr:GtrA family protein [Clostridia bacterium]